MTQYFRTVLQVEVLSNEPLELTDLEAINYEITEGGCSGQVTVVVDNEQVTKDRMAELLVAQDSDPGFLLAGEDDE